MAVFYNSTLSILKNGNFSSIQICIGNTEEEAIKELKAQNIDYTKDGCFLIVHKQYVSKELSSAKIRFHLNIDSIIDSFTVTCDKLEKKNADEAFVELCGFFDMLCCRRQKETFTNDFENELRCTNELCVIDVRRSTNRLMEMFDKSNKYSISIHICSRIALSDMANDTKSQCLRSLIPIKKQNICSQNKMLFISLVCFLLLSIFSLIKFYKQNYNSASPEVNTFLDTKKQIDVVYICTGPQSKSYHLDVNCYGLQNCSGNIEEISLEEVNNINRKPCRYCCK